MNFKYIFYPFCAALFILTTLVLSEKPADQILSIPYTYSPNNLATLAPSVKNLQLQDDTLFWEVIAQHTQSSKGLTAATETLSAGVCVFDANNDGWMDLFVVGGSGFSRHYGKKSWWNNAGGNRLLINDDGQRFIDLTAESGLQKRQWATSCATADLNLDGLQDIIITGYGQNRLFQQTDKLKFIDVTQNSGVFSDNWSTGAAIGDFNNDGLADIYITNLVQFEKGKRTFEKDSGFKSSITENFSPSLYDPEPNRLYLNLGNMRFESVEKAYKIDNAFGRSLIAKWHDFNDDNWLDLIVINDFNSPNQIYLNQSGRKFIPAQDNYSTFHLTGSRDMAIVQPNIRQPQDHYSYFFSRSAGQSNVLLSKVASPSSGYVDLARKANLASNLHLSTDNWGAIAVDINNDGYQDIYQTSGSLIPDQESKFVTQRQSNNLYINSPTGFSANTISPTKNQPIYSSRAVASADLNNDGQLELIVANNNGPLQILSSKTVSDRSWLGLEMETKGQNYSPQRAEVEIHSEQGYLDYTLDYKQALFAQSDPRIHLGLGNLKSNVDLKVSWPDGQVAEFSNLAIDRYYRINKSTGQIKQVIYPVNSGNNKIVELAHKASQPNIHRLLDIAFFSNDKIALNYLWSKADADNKINLLNRIANNTNLHNQTWLFSALQDSNEQVVLTALRIFKQKEWDHSVIYLLPLFDHQSNQVVCAIAQMFAFFFNEEEALPVRKGLAVAPIMKSLGSANDDKKVCLLEALAASENKRAVLSVIDTLNNANNSQVQSKAVETLGLIRDARGSIEIKRILQTTQSAQVISSAMIALKRLSDADFSTVFAQSFAPQENQVELIRQLDGLNLLLTSSDGVVINRPLVIQALTELKEFIDDLDGSSSLKISLLRTISNSNDRQFQALAETLLVEENTQIQAAIALFKIGDVSGRQKANNILLNLSNHDLLIMLGLLAKQNVALPLETIKALAIRATVDQPLSENILALGHDIGHENYQRWLIEVLKRADDAKTLISIINHAIQFDVKGQISHQNMLLDRDPEIILAYLNWQYLQSTGYSDNQMLKLRLLLNRLLREKRLSKEVKQSLLILATKHDPFIANNFLFNNKVGITEAQIAAIFIKLQPLQRSNEQIKLFERILNNQNLAIDDRLVAAVGLLSNHPDRKQEILAKL